VPFSFGTTPKPSGVLSFLPLYREVPIGGRRTACLVSEWLKQGHRVQVIRAETSTESDSNYQWLDSTTLNTLPTLTLPRNNRVNAHANKKGWQHKLAFRFWRWYYTLRYRANPYDQAVGLEKELMHAVYQLYMETPFDFIYCSAAPFHLAYFTVNMAQDLPLVKTWIDLRDPWITATNYGFKTMSKSLLAEEKRREEFVLNHTDLFSAPYEELKEEYAPLLSPSALQKKWHHLPHFWAEKKTRNNGHAETEDYVYAGEIYEGCEPYFAALNPALDHLKQQQPQRYKQLRILIVGHRSTKLKTALGNHSCVHFLPYMGEKVNDLLSQAKAIIIAQAPYNQDYHTTKFFDNLGYQKPYAYVGPAGQVYQTITSRKIGLRLEEFIQESTEKFEYIGSPEWQQWHDSMSVENQAESIIRRMISSQ
jgi:hypothetical protein